MIGPRRFRGKGVEGLHQGPDTVTRIVTFSFGIQHSVQPRRLISTPYCSP